MSRNTMLAEIDNYCDYSECDSCGLKDFPDAYDCNCRFHHASDDIIESVYQFLLNNSLIPQNEYHNITKIEKHAAICNKLNRIYEAKNADYGDSFGETFKKLGIISAVTRISDKMNRLTSLAVNNDAKVKDEKIEDTLMDMANYAIMTLIELGYEVDE